MKAVLRAITKLPEIRDRSVVRSSVIPSAKYSWSGSLDRFSNGNTTKDKRGDGALAKTDGLGGLAVDIATAGTLRCGQLHQTALAMTITATRAAAITVRCGL